MDMNFSGLKGVCFEKTARMGCLYAGGHCTRISHLRRMKMKSNRIWPAILIIALVLGMAVIGCGDGGIETVTEPTSIVY
jgi:hypothetical protein